MVIYFYPHSICKGMYSSVQKYRRIITMKEKHVRFIENKHQNQLFQIAALNISNTCAVQ